MYIYKSIIHIVTLGKVKGEFTFKSVNIYLHIAIVQCFSVVKLSKWTHVHALHRHTHTNRQPLERVSGLCVHDCVCSRQHTGCSIYSTVRYCLLPIGCSYLSSRHCIPKLSLDLCADQQQLTGHQ